MRPSQRLEIKVGLLIILGVIAVVVMIMLSDKVSFEQYYRVSAFMKDAGGLRLKSPVTLSGIGIGHVERIKQSINPRGPIEVDMKILTSAKIPSDSDLELATSGIFGDSSLAFVARTTKPSGEYLASDGSAEVTATPGFLDEATTQAKGILKSLSGILDDQTRDDTKRLIHNAADLAENLSRQNQRLTDVLENLRGVTADLKKTMASLAERSDSIAAHIDKTLGTVEERVRTLTDRADATMAKVADLAGHADQLLVDHREDIGLMIRKFRDISVRVADISAEIESGQGLLGQLIVNRDLAKDVNAIAVDLAVAADLVNDHPRALIFGLSDAQRDEYRARRDRLKMRRSFQEGFGTKNPTTAAPVPPATVDTPAPAPAPVPAPVP